MNTAQVVDATHVLEFDDWLIEGGTHRPNPPPGNPPPPVKLLMFTPPVPLPEVVVPVRVEVVPVTTVSPLLRPVVIWANEVVTRPTWTSTVVGVLPLFKTCTVYPAVAEPCSAVAGTRRELSTEAVVTVTVALMPESTVTGGLVSVTVTAYVATLLEPLVEDATGTICVRVPGTDTLAPVTETVADCPILRLEMSYSAKLAVATIGPTEISTA